MLRFIYPRVSDIDKASRTLFKTICHCHYYDTKPKGRVIDFDLVPPLSMLDNHLRYQK